MALQNPASFSDSSRQTAAAGCKNVELVTKTSIKSFNNNEDYDSKNCISGHLRNEIADRLFKW